MKPSELLKQYSKQIQTISQQFSIQNPRLIEKENAIFQDNINFNLNESDIILVVDTNEQTTLFDLYGLQMELTELLNLNVKVLTQRNIAQIIQEKIERCSYPIT